VGWEVVGWLGQRRGARPGAGGASRTA
jgi:hypothetical protein